MLSFWKFLVIGWLLILMISAFGYLIFTLVEDLEGIYGPDTHSRVLKKMQSFFLWTSTAFTMVAIVLETIFTRRWRACMKLKTTGSPEELLRASDISREFAKTPHYSSIMRRLSPESRRFWSERPQGGSKKYNDDLLMGLYIKDRLNQRKWWNL